MVFTMLFLLSDKRIQSVESLPVNGYVSTFAIKGYFHEQTVSKRQNLKILNFNVLSNIMITKHEPAPTAVRVFIFSVGELFLYGIDRKDH